MNKEKWYKEEWDKQIAKERKATIIYTLAIGSLLLILLALILNM